MISWAAACGVWVNNRCSLLDEDQMDLPICVNFSVLWNFCGLFGFIYLRKAFLKHAIASPLCPTLSFSTTIL